MSKTAFTILLVSFYFRGITLVHYMFIPQLYYDIVHADRFVYYIFLDNHTYHFEGLKSCLLDLYDGLKRLSSLLIDNENAGIKTRITLIENDKPMFMKLYNSENLLTGKCNWTYKVEEITPLVKRIEKEYNFIINNFTTPVTKPSKGIW